MRQINITRINERDENKRFVCSSCWFSILVFFPSRFSDTLIPSTQKRNVNNSPGSLRSFLITHKLNYACCLMTCRAHVTQEWRINRSTNIRIQGAMYTLNLMFSTTLFQFRCFTTNGNSVDFFLNIINLDFPRA